MSLLLLGHGEDTFGSAGHYLLIASEQLRMGKGARKRLKGYVANYFGGGVTIRDNGF